MMLSVALTGAAGYLGQKMLTLLVKSEQVGKIICTDRRDLPGGIKNREKVEFHRLDIRDGALAEIFKSRGVDRVVHLAFVVDPIRNRSEMRSINTEGAKNVCRAAAECGAGQLIAASSTSAFGAFPDNPPLFDEDAPPRMHEGYAYAEDKYAVELALKDFAATNTQIRVAVARPCIVYGPGVDNYLSRFILKWPFLLQIGASRPLMQFVHEDDVAAALLLILEKNAQGCFHIVGEGLLSTEEIAALAGIRVLALPPGLAYPLVNLLYALRVPGVEAPARMLDFIRYRWTASDSRSRKLLQFEPRYSSKEVIATLVESRRKQSVQKPGPEKG